MKSRTEIIIKAMRILSTEVHSDDGVANYAIAEAAERLSELQQLNAELAEQVQTIKHVALELSGVISEYEQMQEKSLRARMFDTNHHYMNRIAQTPAQSLAEHDREVAAMAVEKFGEHLVWDRMFAKSEVRVASAEYANKIKSGEVSL